MTAIGFVGLGEMGSRIAERLLGNNTLYGTNRTPEKAAPLIGRGMIWLDSPREVAEAADVVFTMVSDDCALRAIAEGPRGILAGLTTGKILVDMSTVSPRGAAGLASLVAARGASMVSAPVSGSVDAAANGSLAIMAGGRMETIEAVEPLLRRFGRRVAHLDTQAKALTLKLAINANLAAQMLAFSEGLMLAEHAGIDPAFAVSVMTDSAIGSPALVGRAPMVLDVPERGWFAIRAMHKDLGLTLDVARDLQTSASSSETALSAFEHAEADGFSQRDIAALYRALEVRSQEPDRAASPT